jgi:carnitine O-acetyltransferase
VNFELSNEDSALAAAATKHRQALFDTFNTSVLSFDAFGASRLKLHKTSPDAFAQVWRRDGVPAGVPCADGSPTLPAYCVRQLALQLAYYRVRGQLVGTYESNSTRGFLHGRTETVCARGGLRRPVHALSVCASLASNLRLSVCGCGDR